ncbi:MAG: hypothetical protein ACOH2H_21010 [Cypionkella sp.]
MNALAELEEFEPILLCLDHNQHRKVHFAQLQAKGAVAPRVQKLSVPEACYQEALNADVKPFDGLPKFDQTHKTAKKVVFTRHNQLVMVDRTKEAPIGFLTKRAIPNHEGELGYHLIDGGPHQLLQKKPMVRPKRQISPTLCRSGRQRPRAAPS